MAQRALSHAWISSSPFSEPSLPEIFPQYSQFSSENISCTTETGSNLHLCSNKNDLNPTSTPTFSPLNSMVSKPSFCWANPNGDFPPNFMFSPPTFDVSSMIFNPSPVLIPGGDGNNNNNNKVPENIEFESSNQPQHHHFNSFSSPEIQERTIEFPFNLPTTSIGGGGDDWKSHLSWDSPGNCNSEISTTYSSPNKCYT